MSTSVEQLLAKIRESRQEKQFEYNPEQQRAVDLALSGKSLLITGPAGSGKSTTSKMIIDAISTSVPPISITDHKTLTQGSPAIAIVSFTNKAVHNFKGLVADNMQLNCMTIHKLLEYRPEFYETVDPESGERKTSRTFEPGRHQHNPLPDLAIILIDEGTTVEVPLWNNIVRALRSLPQIIIVGDIHQLPPIFGKSIFIQALNLGIETVELTKIYRQAANSPIIALAHRIKDGKQIPLNELETFARTAPEGKVTIRPWKKKLEKERALRTANDALIKLIESGEYDPSSDIILTPFNKAFGTIGINAAIATYLAQKADAEVFEIFSGVQKKYFRIGDKIIHRGMEGQIVKIERNGLYYGKRPRPASKTLTYTGLDTSPSQVVIDAETEEDIDRMLEHLASHTEEAEKISREASHKITIYNSVLDSETEMSSSGEINAVDLGYAITVHKSIGSEWNRVFFVTHHSQAIMLYRELLYTAVTRAARELYIICEPNLFVQGVNSQRIPGNTLEQKIESFNRVAEMEQKRKISNPNQEVMGIEMLVSGNRR